MTKLPGFAFFFFACSAIVDAQTPAALQRQLDRSHYLRHTMVADTADAGISRWARKKATNIRNLPLADDLDALKILGPGNLRIDRNRTHSGKGSVIIETPSSLPVKNPSNRSYAFAELMRPLNGENLEGINRFSVWVYADAPGFNSVFVGCTLYNGGKHPMPAPGRFEGQHYSTIYPNKWQQIVWEIPDIYRDSVAGFSVSIMLSGSPKGAADTMRLYVDDMQLDRVEAENTRGFALRRDAIAWSHSGYRTDAVKQALVAASSLAGSEAGSGAGVGAGAAPAFRILAPGGRVAFSGHGRSMPGGLIQLDFSSLKTPGIYTLRVGPHATRSFPIGDDAYIATAWHTLNFFFAERCGYDQPGIHQVCHQDAYCIHPDGRKVSVSGGWHDAADLTQGIGNTARAGISMLELATTVKTKQPLLYDRILEEARWGLDWTLQTRFGDGYREGGLIMGIWSDNIAGTKDDMEGKASNNPGDNLIAASYCALAAPFYKDDAAFYYLLRRAAIEDFGFGLAMVDSAITQKNETDLNAQVAVSAMYLYKLTRDERYLNYAAKAARIVMAAQQVERRQDWSIPLHGFFYESREKKRILAYFHRSDEEMMVEGLTMLLAEAPHHPDAVAWKKSCQAYADYLHDISPLMGAYGVLPAAVYEVGNADFGGIYHEGAAVGMPTMEEYNAQVKNGVRLGGGFYLRRFPVAYQFRGFHAVTLGKAKAAMLLSEALGDRSLRDIGTRQLEYIVGFNPFAMSTIWGDGSDYPPLYGAYAGDVVGAVPVGIETFENDDEPYMPMQVNATYKEIWTHSTASVMWMLSKIMKE